MLIFPPAAHQRKILPARVLISGTDEIYMEGLRRILLRGIPDKHKVQIIHLVQEEAESPPDLVIVQMDATYPPEDYGKLRTRYPGSLLLAFGPLPSQAMLYRGIEQGIRGFVGMGSSSGDWWAALLPVLSGRTSYDVRITALLQSFQPADLLSPREREVLQWAAKGLGDKEIADLLRLGCSTVNTHLKRVYRKLGVHSRAAAVAVAMERGEITPSATAAQPPPKLANAPPLSLISGISQ